jgi:hypothetical protein
MFTRIAVLALSAVMASASVINQSNGDISGEAGRKLVQNARRVQNNQYGEDYNYQDIDTSFIAGYSVKFQGCHHVQKWNDEAEDEDDIKILTQRLVRFRMCPADTCSSSTTKGCDSNYGDYLVDMETYVDAYMTNMQNQYAQNNQYYGGNRGLEMDLADYMTCSEMDMDGNQRKLARELAQNGYYYNNYANEDVAYYVGPYCAEQGGEIRIGVFYDDTCTVAADNGEEIFKMVNNGMTLPYSESSIVNLGCLSCGGYGEVNELCETLYESSGKCEEKMNVYYPNESSCSYIEGIKVIREDGVIRTSATRKSTAAAISTGVFLTASLLLSGYVYYLRTKLGRARINLAASSQGASL